jgi:hypothetical protein
VSGDRFDLDDGGAFATLAGSMVATGVRMGVQAYALTRTFGIKLQAQVKANAAGRPGPRVQTGDYNRSIGLIVAQTAGAVVASVGTNKAQGRRLELGFEGVDSLGRSYSQPPYPHFGPAADAIEPEFVAASAALGTSALADAIDVASASTVDTTRLRDDRGRFVRRT